MVPLSAPVLEPLRCEERLALEASAEGDGEVEALGGELPGGNGGNRCAASFRAEKKS